MRLGPLEITWRMKLSQRAYDRAIVRGIIVDLLTSDAGTPMGQWGIRQMIAKVGRAEVKDAVDELMEQIGAANPHLEISRPDRMRGCTHTDKTMGDGVTRCYACNPELVVP